MSHSEFTKAMMEEVCRQNGQGIYYSVVTMEAEEGGDAPYRMEKVDFQPGNPGHDCYSTAKAISSIAVGILYDRGLLKPSDPSEESQSTKDPEASSPEEVETTPPCIIVCPGGIRDDLSFQREVRILGWEEGKHNYWAVL